MCACYPCQVASESKMTDAVVLSLNPGFSDHSYSLLRECTSYQLDITCRVPTDSGLVTVPNLAIWTSLSAVAVLMNIILFSTGGVILPVLSCVVVFLKIGEN